MLTPGAAPAGRALVKEPAAYTVLPTTTWVQTTPLTCTVSNGSVETVAGPLGGWVSPYAGEAEPARASSSANSSATSEPDLFNRAEECAMARTP